MSEKRRFGCTLTASNFLKLSFLAYLQEDFFISIEFCSESYNNIHTFRSNGAARPLVKTRPRPFFELLVTKTKNNFSGFSSLKTFANRSIPGYFCFFQCSYFRIFFSYQKCLFLLFLSPSLFAIFYVV